MQKTHENTLRCVEFHYKDRDLTPKSLRLKEEFLKSKQWMYGFEVQ